VGHVNVKAVQLVIRQFYVNYSNYLYVHMNTFLI